MSKVLGSCPNFFHLFFLYTLSKILQLLPYFYSRFKRLCRNFSLKLESNLNPHFNIFLNLIKFNVKMLGRGNLRNPIGQQLQFTSDKLKEKEVHS